MKRRGYDQERREIEKEREIFEYEMNWVKPQVCVCVCVCRHLCIKRCREQNLDKLRGIEEVLMAKLFDVSRNTSSFY